MQFCNGHCPGICITSRARKCLLLGPTLVILNEMYKGKVFTALLVLPPWLCAWCEAWHFPKKRKMLPFSAILHRNRGLLTKVVVYMSSNQENPEVCGVFLY